MMNVVTAAMLGLAVSAAAQPATFTDVKVRFVEPGQREMKEKDAQLAFDHTAKRLRVTSKERPLDVAYDDVREVVVEVDTLGRKAGFGASLVGTIAGGVLLGDAITTQLDKPFDGDHFVHLTHRKSDGTEATYGLVVGQASVPPAMAALQRAFGSRVQVPSFVERMEVADAKTFKSDKSKLRYVGTVKSLPLPEPRADKAVVLVVSPATIMRQLGPEKDYWTARIYANGKLVGANGPGTYVFFELDPGEYFLASETHDVVGLRLKAEAGQVYYLTQTQYSKGSRLRSFLTRHSKQLVMYEVAGAFWSNWGRESEVSR